MKEQIKLCPKFESAFQLLGKRWTGLIIKCLMSGMSRFSEIESSVPNLSSKMLTERFKELEEAGIIKREVYPETPVRIEYELTEKGRDLSKVMKEISHWAEKWC